MKKTVSKTKARTSRRAALRQAERRRGLMFQALDKAVLARGAEVEFVDHLPHTPLMANHMARQIESMAETLGLLMAVRCDGAHVFVRSLFVPHHKRLLDPDPD